MALRFYNTLSQQVEEFTPASQNTVRMSPCAPPVYDFAHIQVSGPQVATQDIPNVTLGIGSSSGGLIPCGVPNDIQAFLNSTNLECDTGIATLDRSEEHTSELQS